MTGKILIEVGVCIGANSVILPKRGLQYIMSHIKAGSVVY